MSSGAHSPKNAINEFIRLYLFSRNLGNITATTITTTAGPQTLVGDINVQGGGVSINSNSGAIRVASGGAASTSGQATLVAGTKTVSTTAAAGGATQNIFLTVQALGTVAAPKALTIGTIVPGVSFDIVSEDGTDTSVIGWWILNT